MRRHIFRSILFLGLFVVAGCSLLDDAAVDKSEQVNGYWEAVSGDLQFAGAPGAIYYYNWYFLEVSSSGQEVSVTWDNGRTCITTAATLENNQIHLTIGGVETTFTVDSATLASVRFEADGKTYTKVLVKKRTSPDLGCI